MMRLLFLGILLQGAVCSHLCAQFSKTMLWLPDSGQTQGFTNTPGEDADYNLHPPFLLNNGNGTITDTVTGLMWQQIDGGEMTIENADLYCQNLVLGGFENWRLPNAQEAFSILNHGHQNPPLDPDFFPPSGAEYWWTSERQAGNPNKVWVTNAGGGIGNHPKSETISAGGNKKFHVRAVRDIQAPASISIRFILTDSTVMDVFTGLEWQRMASDDALSWEEALQMAENLNYGGHSDWRLPNTKELESINDETHTAPSLATDIFPGVGIRHYWTSTTLPNQPTRAWYMDTQFGIMTYAEKTTPNYLLCVRTGNTPTSAVPDANASTQPDFKVFPNPFSDRLHLVPRPGEGGVQLFDSYSRLVFSGSDLSDAALSDLPAGVYYLKINAVRTTMVRLLKF